MPTYKCVITTWVDSVNAEDGIQITPHFNVPGGGISAQGLADDVLAKWRTYLTAGMQGTQKRVQLYIAGAPAPNYPVAVAEQNLGVATAASTNREPALCLSYHDGLNRPRHRGRLYLANCLTGNVSTGARPTSTHQTKILDFVTVLNSMGAGDADWGLWSTVDAVFRRAAHAWCDNAWDVQRRRGVKATARAEVAVTQP